MQILIPTAIRIIQTGVYNGNFYEIFVSFGSPLSHHNILGAYPHFAHSALSRSIVIAVPTVSWVNNITVDGSQPDNTHKKSQVNIQIYNANTHCTLVVLTVLPFSKRSQGKVTKVLSFHHEFLIVNLLEKFMKPFFGN